MSGNHQDHHTDHGHHAHDHGHSHGIVDPSITASERGLWALKWSFAGLMITAVLQVVVVAFSGSVALLADTIHNFADAATAIPLAIAFVFARRKPSIRFGYGFGRIEDLAGVAIVLVILASAIGAGYHSIQRLLQPQEVSHLWAVAAASVIGFIGNEAVAMFRIRIGREINSAALVADGYHARIDGWTSLAVLGGVVGLWLGYPLADPIIGLLITATIFGIVIQSGKSIFTRMLDGADPEISEKIRQAAEQMPQVQEVTEVRVRWLGHRLHAELNIAVDSQMTVAMAHSVAAEVRHRLLHQFDYLSLVVIHVDPMDHSGERHHHIDSHAHDGLPVHAHAE
ncbi:MAG TPA: cation diffusion facilitator family transporter [Xanthobacteraceae bacterium]|nr:cation diffusion facilitator family transporter [Xanthobacteraceae bacterium]